MHVDRGKRTEAEISGHGVLFFFKRDGVYGLV